jgi:hypothetical protein
MKTKKRNKTIRKKNIKNKQTKKRYHKKSTYEIYKQLILFYKKD